jgi:hypothetical protein
VVEDLSYISKTASSLSCQSNCVGAMFAMSCPKNPQSILLGSASDAYDAMSCSLRRPKS